MVDRSSRRIGDEMYHLTMIFHDPFSALGVRASKMAVGMDVFAS